MGVGECKPLRIPKIAFVELRKNGLLSTGTRDFSCIFDSWVIFGPVMNGESSKFLEIGKFSKV